MKTNPIPTEFSSNRSVRSIIINTINFLSTNYKGVMASFLTICTLFIMPLVIFGHIYPRTFHTHKMIADFSRSFSDWSFVEVVRFLLTMVSITATANTTSSYIKLYIVNKRKPSITEVWKEFTKGMISQFFFFSFIYFILYLGFLLFIIPGLYLLPIVSLCTIIKVMEDRTPKDIIKMGFAISKSNWGMVSLLLLISLIIMVIILETFLKLLAILFVRSGSEATSLLLQFSSTYLVHFLLIIPFTLLVFCYLAIEDDKVK